MSAYTEGFSLPEGLRRHLVGWGNASQCEVMAAASAMARDYFRSKFEPIERAREAEKLQQRKQREATERLYRTEPSGPGKLRDDVWLRTARPEEEMGFAETRLTELGFELVVDGRIHSYTRAGDSWIVYADPRPSGGISFELFRPRTAKSNSKVSWERQTQRFVLQDGWKKNLPTKFANWLSQALEASRPRRAQRCV